MTLNQLWQIIVAAKWLILICLLGCMTGAMVVGLRQPKIYEARARVLLAVMSPDEVTGARAVTNKTIETYVRTQALLAVSNRTAGLVVDKLGWANNPAVIDGWMAATGGVGDIRTWASGLVQQNMAAYALEGGGTLEIIYRAPDLEAAIAIAGIVRQSYIETSLALETEAATRRADRMEQLAKTARTRLEIADIALGKQQKALGMVVNASGVDIEDSQFNNLQGRTINTRLAATQRTISATKSIAKDSFVVQLQRQLSDIETELALSGGRYGPNNPRYISLQERRRYVQGQIAIANAAARASAGQVAAVGRANIARADADYARERARVIAKAPTDARLKQSLRMVEMRRDEYQRLTANAAAMRMLSTRSESSLVVLGDVIAEPDPVSPNIPLIFGLSLAFGLGLGVTSALFRGLVRREVLGREDLAFATGVPILGTLPKGPKPPSRWRRWFDQRGGLAPAAS